MFRFFRVEQVRRSNFRVRCVESICLICCIHRRRLCFETMVPSSPIQRRMVQVLKFVFGSKKRLVRRSRRDERHRRRRSWRCKFVCPRSMKASRRAVSRSLEVGPAKGTEAGVAGVVASRALSGEVGDGTSGRVLSRLADSSGEVLEALASKLYHPANKMLSTSAP